MHAVDMEKKNKTHDESENAINSNRDWQGVDKDPVEEKEKSDKVTKEDLKGKKVDADPTRKEDRPSK